MPQLEQEKFLRTLGVARAVFGDGANPVLPTPLMQTPLDLYLPSTHEGPPC